MTSTVLVSIGAVTLALLILGAGAAALFVYLRREFKPAVADQGPLELRVAQLELQVRELPSIWEDERKRAKRSADAARAARKSAEEKLEEVAELIEANEQIPIEYGEGSEAPGMLDMPGGLAPAHESGVQERVANVAHLMR